MVRYIRYKNTILKCTADPVHQPHTYKLTAFPETKAHTTLQTYLNIVYNTFYFSDDFSIYWSRGRSRNMIALSWVKYYLGKINIFLLPQRLWCGKIK